MKIKFIFNVFGTWLLVVGGMSIATRLSPDRSVFPIIATIGLLPAGLFMKFRLPISWLRFLLGSAILVGLAVVLTIFRKLNIGTDVTPMIAIGLIALTRPFIDRKELQNN